MSAAKYRFPPEADNPDLENVALHQKGEVQCLHFLNRLSRIAQFGYRKLPKNIANTGDSNQVFRASGVVGANYIEANESLNNQRSVFRI